MNFSRSRWVLLVGSLTLILLCLSLGLWGASAAQSMFWASVTITAWPPVSPVAVRPLNTLEYGSPYTTTAVIVIPDVGTPQATLNPTDVSFIQTKAAHLRENRLIAPTYVPSRTPTPGPFQSPMAGYAGWSVLGTFLLLGVVALLGLVIYVFHINRSDGQR